MISESDGASTPFYSTPVLATGFGIALDVGCVSINSFSMVSSDTQQIYGCVYWNNDTTGLDFDEPSSSDTSDAALSGASGDSGVTVTALDGGTPTITWDSEPYQVDRADDYQSFEAQVQVAVTQPAELIISTSSRGVGDCYWANGAQF